MITYHPFGDSALLINFEQRIDPKINRKVIQWYQAIKSAKIKGTTFCSPAYCSITIGYQPHQITFNALQERIASLEIHQGAETKIRELKIPVCYDPKYALDLHQVSPKLGLTPDEVIALHTSVAYQVYMIGFLPGFTYMGTLHKKLECKRKATPRLKVPARSVGLAGLQTGIYPGEAPGGWQIIGRTPVEIFDSSKAEPYLFRPGDTVTFYSITAKEFLQMENDPAAISWSEYVLS